MRLIDVENYLKKHFEGYFWVIEPYATYEVVHIWNTWRGPMVAYFDYPPRALKEYIGADVTFKLIDPPDKEGGQ